MSNKPLSHYFSKVSSAKQANASNTESNITQVVESKPNDENNDENVTNTIIIDLNDNETNNVGKDSTWSNIQQNPIANKSILESFYYDELNHNAICKFCNLL